MNNLVGYFLNRNDIFRNDNGASGTAYNYYVAANGVWIGAANEHLSAVVQITDVKIRGLVPIKPFCVLKHGRIPQRLWDLALSVLLAHPEEERYAGIRWNGAAYDLYYPEQTGGAAEVGYNCGENIVFEMHSHPGMAPEFSQTDNDDEQGLKIYGVLKIDTEDKPSLVVNLRLGVYGYYHPVEWSEVFEGELGDVKDVNEEVGDEK